MDGEESLAVTVARIDENVKHIKGVLGPIKKKIDRHEKELWTIRILFLVGLVIAGIKWPVIAELVAGMFS